MNQFVFLTMEENLALVRLEAPEEKVNILNEGFLRELDDCARQLASQTHIRAAVVFSGKPAGFIAGADITTIAGVITAAEGEQLARQGQQIFNRWAALPFPVVAAIHGHCLGGGTEFALACRARVAAKDATFALPEVRLGILPGFGGTQRLPRLIALESALDMILTGRTLPAEQARKIGLADRVVPREELHAAARALAGQLAEQPALFAAARARSRSGWRRRLLESNPLGRYLLFQMAGRNVAQQTKGHYPAPPATLQLLRETWGLSLEEGLNREASALGKLVVTEVCKNLVHIFFLSQRAKKGAGLNLPPQPIERVAVVGAGVMGAGIAGLLATKSVPVTLKEIHQSALEAGLAHIRKQLEKKNPPGPEAEARIAAQMALITATLDNSSLQDCDLAIEAVLEKPEVKKAVLSEIEGMLKETAIFATNTSALSVSDLQAAAKRPEKVGGLHFFNPVERMPLVEIIRGRQTSDATIATLYEFALKLGKTPILVADSPGFLVNRLLMAYLNEACLMAGKGIDWASLDREALSFGWPMGPFRLIDEVGIDIAVEVGQRICQTFDYLQPSPLLEQLRQKGLLGKKTGQGFYLYGKPGETPVNPAMKGFQQLASGHPATAGDMRRLLLLMINEAGRCLDDRVVAEPEDIDAGMVFGAGFPPFRGGLCRWADQIGIAELRSELNGLAEVFGERYRPCDFIMKHPAFYRHP